MSQIILRRNQFFLPISGPLYTFKMWSRTGEVAYFVASNAWQRLQVNNSLQNAHTKSIAWCNYQFGWLPRLHSNFHWIKKLCCQFVLVMERSRFPRWIVIRPTPVNAPPLVQKWRYLIKAYSIWLSDVLQLVWRQLDQIYQWWKVLQDRYSLAPNSKP